ncbi:MAG: Stf0 family sulphotransferase [Terrimicrobiaceae bacterium]
MGKEIPSPKRGVAGRLEGCMGGLFHKIRHPRRCYLVCATARSGSNLLTDGLHGTRLAGRPKQFFLPKFESEYAAKLGLEGAGFAEYVQGVIDRSATSNEVFGFKLMAWYLEEFLGRLREAYPCAPPSSHQLLGKVFPRLKYVRIIRRNKLRQAISKARALQTGLWKVQEGNASRAEPGFDPDLIGKCLAEVVDDDRVWDAFFHGAGVEPMVVEYEQLCSDYDATVRSTLEFIGVRIPSHTRIDMATIKQSDAMSDAWEKLYLEIHPGADQPQ